MISPCELDTKPTLTVRVGVQMVGLYPLGTLQFSSSVVLILRLSKSSKQGYVKL